MSSDLPKRVFPGSQRVRALIEASAGTGKTYTIEHLVLDRVSAGVPISEILLVTFTDKAAAELRDRVRLRITGQGGADPLARRALAAFDSATITTLHGFAQRALSWFSIHTPYPCEQKVAAIDDLFPEVLREMIRGPWYRDETASAVLRGWLSDGSLNTLETALRHCVESATPLRFARHLEQLAMPVTEVLGQPQARAAFDISLTRGGLKAEQLHACSGFVSALSEHRSSWQDCLMFLVLTDRAVLKAFIKACEKTLDLLSPGERIAQESWLALALEVLGLPVNFRHLAAIYLLPSLREALDQAKRRRHVMTFSDMIGRLAASLADPLTGPELVRRLQARYRVGIVDEFQDTDSLQWDILQRLFLDREDGQLVVVGDPKQAIYRFRGADIVTYQAAARHLLASGGSRFVLGANHRCTADMVDAINHFFGGAGPDSVLSAQGVRYDDPVTCGNPGLLLEPRIPPMVILGQRYCPHLKKDDWKFELARQVGSELRSLMASGTRLLGSGEGPRRLDYRDVIILVQKHAEGRIIAGVLRAEGIPFSFYKRRTLFDGPEARALLDVLEAVLDPTNPSLQNRAFVTPFFGMEVVALALAGGLPRQHPAVRTLWAWGELAQDGDPMELVQALWMDSGVRERLCSGTTTRRAAINLERIFDILRHQVLSQPTSVRELVAQLKKWVLSGATEEDSAELAMEVTDPGENAVRILTMHNAKGLEAPVVFLYGSFAKNARSAVHEFHSPGEGTRVMHVGTLDRKDPEKGFYDEEALGDDQRLMYVAMTRAKALCYLQIVAEPLPDAQTGVVPKFTGLFGGAKRTVVDRVKDLVTGLGEGRGRPELFEVRIAHHRCWDCGPSTHDHGASAAGGGPGAGPVPGAHELAALAADVQACLAEPDAEAGDLRGRSGKPVFSYSSLKKRSETPEERPADFAADVLPEVPPTDPPPGVHTGLCVHELCETVDCTSLRGFTTVGDWLDAPPTETWIRAALARQGLSGTLWRRVGEMVFSAFRTPVVLPDFSLAQLADCDRIARELEFRIPYDPVLAAGLESVLPSPPREDGWVMGFFDAVLSLHGKIYLVDWKTDLLRDYGPETVASHVQLHYALQANLYASALARMLCVGSEEEWDAVYGGFLYVFVRGFGPGTGVVRLRTRWKELTG